MYELAPGRTLSKGPEASFSVSISLRIFPCLGLFRRHFDFPDPDISPGSPAPLSGIMCLETKREREVLLIALGYLRGQSEGIHVFTCAYITCICICMCIHVHTFAPEHSNLLLWVCICVFTWEAMSSLSLVPGWQSYLLGFIRTDPLRFGLCPVSSGHTSSSPLLLTYLTFCMHPPPFRLTFPLSLWLPTLPQPTRDSEQRQRQEQRQEHNLPVSTTTTTLGVRVNPSPADQSGWSGH